MVRPSLADVSKSLGPCRACFPVGAASRLLPAVGAVSREVVPEDGAHGGKAPRGRRGDVLASTLPCNFTQGINESVLFLGRLLQRCCFCCEVGESNILPEMVEEMSS